MLRFLEAVPKIRTIGVGPELAEQQKVGFFSLDRSSQTDVTEVVDLKEMTEVLQILLQDVSTLRRDINLAKHVMQADYESKLQEKSLELYCRINERVLELEKMHDDRVGTVRRAFRQQLSDGIARVAYLYNKTHSDKLKQEKRKQAGDATKLEEQYKQLQMTIQRNESIIHMLKMQLAQYQQKEQAMADSIEEESLMSKTPSVNQEAEDLKKEVDKLEKKLATLEDNLQATEDENKNLNTQVDTMKEEFTKQKMLLDQLQLENRTMKASAEQDKASSQRLMEKQRKEMEDMMMEKIRKAQEESQSAAQKDAKALQEKAGGQVKLLLDEKKLLEAQLAQERRKNAELSRGDFDVEKMKKVELALRDEILRLKKEIERIHRTWEKKFAILQQSLHALKDESYLRQTLQRQAANLHHAAVSYAVDTPMGIVPSGKANPGKKPLPDISKYGRGGGNTPGGQGDKEYLSYTVSAPSGRGTAMFSADENQIMSENDKEDLPADIMPLPPPQRKPSSRCSDEEKRPEAQIQPRVSAAQ